ncbi:MAG: hypothetical protein M3P06_16850 [Acidobacteriota bacterium]|nr:hypothetical protein [Acidobacteriota bacterium]
MPSPVSAEMVAPPPIDPQRMRVALMMVSDLFGGKIPRPRTPIDQWTSKPHVQIVVVAKLNDSNTPGQHGYGWKTVFASEVGSCAFIEDLIGLVYSKLQGGSPQAQFAEHVESYAVLLEAGDGPTPDNQGGAPA